MWIGDLIQFFFPDMQSILEQDVNRLVRISSLFPCIDYIMLRVKTVLQFTYQEPHGNSSSSRSKNEYEEETHSIARHAIIS
jgi:hypothetical protein